MDLSGLGETSVIILEMAGHLPEGEAWELVEAVAKDIIAHFELELTNDWEKAGGGINFSEVGGKFDHENQTFRIVRRWGYQYEIYRGLWKSESD